MARVSTYLNFPGTTEAAFTFYRSVFGGEFNGPVHRFADIPQQPGQPPMPEADRLFNALSAGGKVEIPVQDMFWGAYFGSFTDRFGINWMVNCAAR